jgi:hypothetical protein
MVSPSDQDVALQHHEPETLRENLWMNDLYFRILDDDRLQKTFEFFEGLIQEIGLAARLKNF